MVGPRTCDSLEVSPVTARSDFTSPCICTTKLTGALCQPEDQPSDTTPLLAGRCGRCCFTIWLPCPHSPRRRFCRPSVTGCCARRRRLRPASRLNPLATPRLPRCADIPAGFWSTGISLVLPLALAAVAASADCRPSNGKWPIVTPGYDHTCLQQATAINAKDG